ncbi:hypothetical protein [Paenibacillus sp. L3-i20]|uniref:hypothetical protein n=1 Tax=Paenibacillus sp. L3-i20 TaxID=2905833 RepID=UPI0020C13371|nr:hypothetical protein [Paenibacillus sp. L3-i20]
MKKTQRRTRCTWLTVFFLRSEGDERRRTNSYEKVCSDSLEELSDEAAEVGKKRNKIWAWCPFCKKKVDEKETRF